MESDKRVPKARKARNVPLAFRREKAHVNKKAYNRKRITDEGSGYA